MKVFFVIMIRLTSQANVAIRNINLIIQKRADILKNEMKVFFVKYNNPIYIKLEKLDIMIAQVGT